MDYKEKYEQGLECIQEILSSGQEKIKMTLLKERLQPFFPELKESEDELTWLTKFIEEEAYSLSMDIRDNEDLIKLKNLQRSLAWLEKQKAMDKEIVFRPLLGTDIRVAAKQALEKIGKKVVLAFNGAYIPVNGKTVSEICNEYDAWLEKQGQEPKKVSIWKHWKNGIAGNGEDKPIYLIKTGYTYSLSSCLSFECDYIELSELDNLLLEKQVEKKTIDKVEPKFKVGDWIIRSAEGFKHNAYRITEVKDYYVCEELKGRRVTFTFDDVRKNFKLWNISDAKDGDVLACGDKVTDCPFIFHNLTEKQNPRSYCGIDTLGEFQVNDENSGFWCYSNEVRPSTKEQRDTLFKKMKEAGYQWDAENKELKLLISNGGDF